MPVKNRIANFQNDMVKWRHYFHENPELAYNEINTSKKVVNLLKQFGISNIEEGFSTLDEKGKYISDRRNRQEYQ